MGLAHLLRGNLSCAVPLLGCFNKIVHLVSAGTDTGDVSDELFSVCSGVGVTAVFETDSNVLSKLIKLLSS